VHEKTLMSKKLSDITGAARENKERKLLNWQISTAENLLIDLIVKRAVDALEEGRGFVTPDELRVRCKMDLVACHLNGCLLDLRGFAFTSNYADFAHDFDGIVKNIDRASGQLMNGFKPIFRVVVN
jgi:hypothetical protein